MVSNDDFDGKATHLNCFYLHINFEQKYPKPAIVHALAIKLTLPSAAASTDEQMAMIISQANKPMEREERKFIS